MNKSKRAMNVLEFYDLTRKLKVVIRSGWKRWNVKADRLESIAEHVYGTCMLAIAIDSEFEYHLDIQKVVLMLAMHELEETIIGDITPFDSTSAKQKQKIGRDAVIHILSPMVKGEEYVKLIDEFNEKSTDEAKFAYLCDKLEADLMSLKYDENGECKYEYADVAFIQNSNLVALKKNGANSMSEFFYKYDYAYVGYDDNFKAILDFAKNVFY